MALFSWTVTDPAGQEIVELHRPAGPELTHLVEADWRIPEPLDVRPRQSRLLPSPPLEVEVRDVVAAGAGSPTEEILEGAAPDDHRPRTPKKVSQLFEVYVELLKGKPEVLVADFGHAFVPDLVKNDKADQTVEIMRGAHSGEPCSTETIQIQPETPRSTKPGDRPRGACPRLPDWAESGHALRLA